MNKTSIMGWSQTPLLLHGGSAHERLGGIVAGMPIAFFIRTTHDCFGSYNPEQSPTGKDVDRGAGGLKPPLVIIIKVIPKVPTLIFSLSLLYSL